MNCRIIAQPLHGHWSAWIENTPQVAFGGDTAATAVLRLLKSAGLCPEQLEVDDADHRPNRQVFRVRQMQDCPDCGASGRYVGLNTVEPCDTCGGLGKVVIEAADNIGVAHK